MKKLIYLFLLAILFVVTPSSFAQKASMSISPSVYHLVTTPGSIHTFDFNFENNGDPQVYTFKLYQLGNPDINGTLKPLKEITAPISIQITAPYIQYDERVLLRTNDTEKIPVEILIPEETAEGEYFFTIAVETIATTPNQGTATVSLENGIGILIPVTVTKDNKDVKKVSLSLQRAVKGFSVPWGNSTLHFIDTDTAIPLSLVAKNSGKFNVVPTGEVILKNQSNQEQRFRIVPTYIYPYSQRLLNTAGFTKEVCMESFTQSLCDNDYSIILKPLPAGLYQITAQVLFGNPDPLVYSHDYFIVLPLLIVGGIMLAIALIVLVVILAWIQHYKSTRRFNSR